MSMSDRTYLRDQRMQAFQLFNHYCQMLFVLATYFIRCLSSSL